MIALLQRVTEASVMVENKTIAAIEQGLLVFVGIEKEDDEALIPRLVDKIINYRVFADQEDKMNMSVKDIRGGMLLVPQFTLAADTNKGCRPSFSSAADPALGKTLFYNVVRETKKKYQNIEAGEFAADMKVSLLNDGPVTFWLQVKK